LTTREKGAGIGALGGAAAGGIIGAAVGHPGAGAAIGGALGLGAGALVGDQLQGQEIKQGDQQRQMDANQAEIERQRREIERIRKQSEYLPRALSQELRPARFELENFWIAGCQMFKGGME
jgi:phage tail tape-measure protein